MYCNMEGVTWLGNDRLVVVSDKGKSDQPGRCARKDQSIHIFKLPADGLHHGSYLLEKSRIRRNRAMHGAVATVIWLERQIRHSFSSKIAADGAVLKNAAG